MNSNEKKYLRRAIFYTVCAIFTIALGIYYLVVKSFSALRSVGILAAIFLLLTFYYGYKFAHAGNYTFTGEYENSRYDDEDEPFFAPEFEEDADEEDDDGSGRKMYPDDIQK